MSFYNPTKNPIPFYSLEGSIWTNFKPLWHRNRCQENFDSPVLFPGVHWFQLKASDNLDFISEVNSVDLRNVTDNTIEVANLPFNFYTDSKGNKYLAINPDLGQSLINGNYYIGVDTESGNYYSETFCIVESSNDYLGLVWASNTKIVGSMIYPEGLKNVINLKATIVPLEPTLERKVIENGFGIEEPTLQVLKQGYVFSFMAPNYLAEAISAIPLHDRVQFANRPEREYSLVFDEAIKEVEVAITAEDDTCYSLVEVRYVKHLIIETACEDELFAVNTPPVAEIVWDDTLTNEDRLCDSSDDCTQIIRITDNTYDPDDNMDYLEWEMSTDGGNNWVSQGNAVGDTKSFPGNIAQTYQYRLKAVDTFGAVGYSNVLKITVFDVIESSVINGSPVEVQATCNVGRAYDFQIKGSPNQTVRVRLQVKSTFGRGFIYKIYNSITNAQLYSWVGGPQGTQVDVNLTLDNTGTGNFNSELCLNPCQGGDTYIEATVGLRLYANDNTTLTDYNFLIGVYNSCY